MDKNIIIALIAAFPATIVAIGGILALTVLRRDIKEIHVSINSRMSQLIDASRAQGRDDVQQGKAT
jgi:biopolymer transport protein ExbB/TolQ